MFEVNEKDQCQEHVAGDLTRSWPRLGDLLVFHLFTMKIRTLQNVLRELDQHESFRASVAIF